MKPALKSGANWIGSAVFDGLKWYLPLGAALAMGCASAVESSKREDQARREVPVPICLESLERHGQSGQVSALQPQDYWKMILPSYDTASGTVDMSAADCAGRQPFQGDQFLGAEGPRTGSIQVKPKDAIITPAADNFKVVWLRTHEFAEGVSAGPLALVRPREGHAEVYAIGTYRGRPKHSRFSLERMGPRILVTASDEGCAKAKEGSACETSMVIYVMSAGRLKASARIPLDRVQYGSAPGIPGSVQYRLTATPVFEEKVVRVVEQVVLQDSSQTPLRKSHLERVFRLQGRGELRASKPSLWEQVKGQARTQPPAADTPQADPPPSSAPAPRKSE